MGIFFLVLYNLLAPFIAAVYLLFFFLSPRRGLLRNLLPELRQRLALTTPSFTERPLWFHAASVGEVKALRGLLPVMNGLYPSRPVMITASTSSGLAQARRLTPYAFLLPLDSYPLMRRFMAGTRPELLMIAETELWPNLLYAAGRSGIKVIMINARLSPRTLAFYRAVSPVADLMFANIAKIAVQSGEDFERYRALLRGTEKLILTGNIKYDLVAPQPQDGAEIMAFIGSAGWKDKQIFCAGSTHPEEEDLILEAFLKVKAALPDTRMIIAPRHPETASATAARLRNKGLTAPLWSRRAHTRSPLSAAEPADRQRGYPGPDCLLVDELGRLADMYFYSTVVFVGGTLDETGGHNVLEPSAFSKPVFFGPNVKHTREGALALINKNGGFMVETAGELADKIISLLQNPAALEAAGAASKAALESLQGATRKTLELISQQLG
ncbi:MAG: glycosyltransferase N-terminal domain-containing protein [Elusimicrobiales bacterium]|jgi:3-deoxy-D-manno-octulosonic-acid transferase